MFDSHPGHQNFFSPQYSVHRLTLMGNWKHENVSFRSWSMKQSFFLTVCVNTELKWCSYSVCMWWDNPHTVSVRKSNKLRNIVINSSLRESIITLCHYTELSSDVQVKHHHFYKYTELEKRNLWNSKRSCCSSSCTEHKLLNLWCCLANTLQRNHHERRSASGAVMALRCHHPPHLECSSCQSLGKRTLCHELTASGQ